MTVARVTKRNGPSRSVGRPGRGGRLSRATPFTGTSATASLIAELGQPEITSHAGAQLMRWPVEDEGDGILLGRLSGRELQGGETAMGQVHPLRQLAERWELRTRLIVVTVNNSGARRYEDRPDLQLVEAAITAGWCRWVAWRRPDRIAREVLPAELFYDLIRRSGTMLYVGDLGRAVDWSLDRLYLRTLGIVSAEERESIRERTQDALVRRFLDEGRGWPATKRFGFRRNPATKYLEVDPEQWPFVELLHNGYAEFDDGRGGGTRKLAERLRALGCELSREQVRVILQDPIYVTGEYSVRHGGTLVPQKPIPLPSPIPAELFARNQRLLRLRRGSARRTRQGDFCLNAIPLLHGPCEHERNAQDEQPRLRGRVQGDREIYAYRHSPWTPKGCRGFVVSRDGIEPPVLRELRQQLASWPALREAWAQATKRAAGERQRDSDLPVVERESDIRRRVGQRRRQIAQLTRSYLERLDNGEAANEVAYWQLVGALEGEIEQLERRLALRKAVGDPRPATVATPTADLASALAAVLMPDVPPDDKLRIARATIVQAIISRITVRGSADDLMLELGLRVPKSGDVGQNPDDPHETPRRPQWSRPPVNRRHTSLD